MAATETKLEPNETEEHEQAPETLVSNNIVLLRVSIHCQGCKKKVHKILQNVHGVDNIEIDMRQHRVEVTGNVNGETLIKKLTKAGKHAEFWPEKTDSKMKRLSKAENRERQIEAEEESSEGIGENENDKESVKVNVAQPQDTLKNTFKNTEGCATGKAGVKFHEPIKQEVRHTVVLPPAGPVTEKKVSIAVQVPNDNEASVDDNQTGGTRGGGNVGKKKKKKVNINTGNVGKPRNIINNTTGNDGASSSTATTVTVENHSDDALANVNGNGPPGNQSHGQGHVHHHRDVNGPGFQSSSSVPIFSRAANESPPRDHNIYRQYPPHYYAAPPQVVHNVSYHAAHSSSSYGASYYASPQPYSYAHVVRPGNDLDHHHPPYMYEPESYTPSYTPSYTTSQPSDSFELFSDENPNACSLM